VTRVTVQTTPPRTTVTLPRYGLRGLRPCLAILRAFTGTHTYSSHILYPPLRLTRRSYVAIAEDTARMQAFCYWRCTCCCRRVYLCVHLGVGVQKKKGFPVSPAPRPSHPATLDLWFISVSFIWYGWWLDRWQPCLLVEGNGPTPRTPEGMNRRSAVVDTHPPQCPACPRRLPSPSMWHTQHKTVPICYMHFVYLVPDYQDACPFDTILRPTYTHTHTRDLL